MHRLVGALLLLASACTRHSSPARPGDASTGGPPEDAAAIDVARPSDARPTEADARIVVPDASAPADVAARDRAGGDAAAPADVAARPDVAAGASLCPGAGFTVCESFEDTAVGALPARWARRAGYGGKSMAVAADDAKRGTHALKIEGGLNGSQFLEYKNNLGGLATSHWGRIFFKVKVPAPWPASGVLHGDIVQHLGPHPGGGVNGVRWGIVENTGMKFQWIYNVQPTQGEPEFGDGTAYNYTWPGTWQCLEWRYDQPTQHGELWLDGTQIPIVVGKSHAPEIPVFTSLGVGWSNYQNAPGTGFVVWIDEVAFDEKARIGCDR
jgi:hypothetical protein